MTQPTAISNQKAGTKATDSRLRVLHFVPRVCWPLNTGAKLRNYHLAREIAQRANITLLAFSEVSENADQGGSSQNSTSSKSGTEHAESSTEPMLARPEQFYDRVITVGRDQAYTLGKIVRGAVGRTPLPVLNYTTAPMKQMLARTLDAQDFDIVQVESIHLAEYLPIIRSARHPPFVILDWHNIESELMTRYSERQTSPLRRLYAKRASAQMSRLEQRAVRDFDAHLVVSSRDGARLRELEAGARVSVIENGVDTAYYTDDRIEQAHAAHVAHVAEHGKAASAEDGLRDGSLGEVDGRPRRIAFVGSMDYHANVDAVVNFAEEVWPGLREQQPELIFTIVGRDPAPEVRKLADFPGVEVTGTVMDVRPYYHEMLAAVIPLRVGGGSRLKILEAMAAGVPVVSTTLGAEGLDVVHGRNILIAETADEFRAAIIGLSENEKQRGQLIAGGRALVAEQYDWSRLGRLLFEKYQSLLSR